MKNIFLNSPYLHLFYSFFVLSWLPYFFVRIGGEQWVYSLFYRPNGIVENMTVLFYAFAVMLCLVALVKAVKMPQLWLVLLWAVFMLGEETRWGLPLFVENTKDLSFDSAQKLLQMSFLGWGEVSSQAQQLAVFVTRIVAFIIMAFGFSWVWMKRHQLSKYKEQFLECDFSPYLVLYAGLFAAAVFVEIVLQSGPRKFDYLEETLEMSASLIWVFVAFFFIPGRVNK